MLTMQILKISPKGQITIPKNARDICKSTSMAFEIVGKTMILRPIEIKIVEDDLGDFSALAEKSFEFWENEKDDVYQKFYNKNS